MIVSYGDPVEMTWVEYKSLPWYPRDNVPTDQLVAEDVFITTGPDGHPWRGRYLGSDNGHSLILFEKIKVIGPP